MHVHIGLMFGLIAFASILPIAFFWRLISMHLKDTAIGQAMGFLY